MNRFFQEDPQLSPREEAVTLREQACQRKEQDLFAYEASLDRKSTELKAQESDAERRRTQKDSSEQQSHYQRKSELEAITRKNEALVREAQQVHYQTRQLIETAERNREHELEKMEWKKKQLSDKEAEMYKLYSNFRNTYLEIQREPRIANLIRLQDSARAVNNGFDLPAPVTYTPQVGAPMKVQVKENPLNPVNDVKWLLNPLLKFLK